MGKMKVCSLACGAYSHEESMLVSVFGSVLEEQSDSGFSDRLKCAHKMERLQKHVKALDGENEKSVQNAGSVV